ncbi:MAG TPA: hypothetical protein VMV78_13360 [Thiobacillus sp.]|nr:hypothetical protein [Thiobacillus sp.]
MKRIDIAFGKRTTLDSHWHGIDFGVGLEVLVQFYDQLVVWQRGHSYWSGGSSGAKYVAANLVVLNPAGRPSGFNYIDIHEGRFSQKHFPAVAPRLAKYLGLAQTEAFRMIDALYSAYKGGLTATVTRVDI